MKLVIDANVVKGYFMESVLELKSELTDSTLPIFARLENHDQVFLDDGGHIKHEWRGPVDSEWFDAWYPELLIKGCAFEIPVETLRYLRKNMESKCGFPRGKDFWYIRTAKSVARRYSEAYLISEDVDLYEPRKKGAKGKDRVAILISGNGNVVKLLRKEGIHVNCVASYLYSVNED